MRLPLEWLHEFVEPALDPAALADRLTMGGLEVEDSAPVAPPFSNVRVARIVSVERHPNADRLTVCKVNAGTGVLLNIVCGAPNAAAGIVVPCALPGAVLPGDLTIKATRMRGVASEGMLCSARELGLSDDAAGLLVLDVAAPIGADLREALGLDDISFEIKLTPNRGDCLSVLGVAREVAALIGAPLRPPAFTPVPPTGSERLAVRIEAPDLCGRFSGRIIRGVDARAQTPDWMKRRLERSGQRPISALVDISNYVMLELGRPTHVFDLDKVHGPLTVRWGRAGESLELLNGQTVELDAAVGVIADDKGVESLAGIMGGESTAVSLDTRNVYVEAAFWWPQAIQGRSRRFNFATDAGHRFERGVDFATTVEHIERITRLIVDICGTPATGVGPVDDNVTGLPSRAPVRLRSDRLRRVLGVAIDDERIEQCMRRLGLPFTRERD
ncbi:MAG TPA: phenylalanine--tRNA ligase subunit beta, partial [Burkholderiaceae bacterium]